MATDTRIAQDTSTDVKGTKGRCSTYRASLATPRQSPLGLDHWHFLCIDSFRLPSLRASLRLLLSILHLPNLLSFFLVIVTAATFAVSVSPTHLSPLPCGILVYNTPHLASAKQAIIHHPFLLFVRVLFPQASYAPSRFPLGRSQTLGNVASVLFPSHLFGLTAWTNTQRYSGKSVTPTTQEVEHVGSVEPLKRSFIHQTHSLTLAFDTYRILSRSC